MLRDPLITTYLREDAGSPLGVGMPSGRPLRVDGERHYDAWLRLLRLDPCAYCGGPGGTVDHVEPRSRGVRGLGTAHGWVNVVGACQECNGAKADRSLLAFLHGRHATAPVRRRPRRRLVPVSRRSSPGRAGTARSVAGGDECGRGVPHDLGVRDRVVERA